MLNMWLLNEEKKQYREETKRLIKANKLPRKTENHRRKSLKQQIVQEKRQQRQQRIRIAREQKEKGLKRSSRRALTTSQAQDQVNTLLKQFSVSKNFKHLKGYMEKVQSLKRAYPATIVPLMRLHATKKKKRSFGRSKKSQNVYIMGPETNYKIMKI